MDDFAQDFAARDKRRFERPGLVVDQDGTPVSGDPPQRAARSGRAWPMVMIHGVLMAGFGLLSLVWPQLSATALITMLAIFALIDAVLAIGYGFARRRSGAGGGGWLLQGMLALVIGVVALLWPVATGAAVLTILGFWAVLFGGLGVLTGLGLCRAGGRVWLFPLILGLAGAVVGVLLIANPVSALLGLTAVLGVLFLAIGGLLVARGLRLRTHPIPAIRFVRIGRPVDLP